MSAPKPNLTSTAAVQSQDRSYLFYSRSDAMGNLAYLKSQTAGESDQDPMYKSSNILVDGNVVSANTTSAQIAAVSYIYKNQNEIRVYYISGQGYLRELCRTDGKDWFDGSLNGSKVKASPTSLLTASVDQSGQGQLKLYYNRDDDANLWCTWVSIGNQGWLTRCIENKF